MITRLGLAQEQVTEAREYLWKNWLTPPWMLPSSDISRVKADDAALTLILRQIAATNNSVECFWPNFTSFTSTYLQGGKAAESGRAGTGSRWRGRAQRVGAAGRGGRQGKW